MKKAVKKKPAKKAPAKKLIEGMYSHKFLTRLKPIEGEMLEALMKSTSNKTFNGTVNFLIRNYADKVNALESFMQQLRDAKRQMNIQANLLFTFKQAFKDLQNLKLMDMAMNDEEEEEL